LRQRTADCRALERPDVITCGYLEFGDTRANPILEALPEVLIVRPRDESERKRVACLSGLQRC
jgi:hypothetical protein